jgi:hypothetical protein
MEAYGIGGAWVGMKGRQYAFQSRKRGIPAITQAPQESPRRRRTIQGRAEGGGGGEGSMYTFGQRGAHIEL